MALPQRLTHLLKEQLWREKWTLVLATFCTIGFSLTVLLAPWPMKIVLDQVLLDKPFSPALAFLQELLPNDKGGMLIALAFSIVLIAVLTGLFSYFQVTFTTRVGQHIVHRLRTEILSHLQRLSLAFHRRNRTGELLTKISGDTRALQGLFGRVTLMATAQCFTVGGMLIIMFTMNWELSLVLLVTIPILGLLLLLLNRKITAITKRQRKQEGKLATRINDILGSIALIQAFGREDYEEVKFKRVSTKNLKEGMRAARTLAAGTWIVLGIGAVGTSVTIFFGAWQVLADRMSPGDLLIFIAYVKQVYKPFRQLTRFSAQFARATVSLKRLGEVLAEEPHIFDCPNAMPASNLKGEIVFDHVSFGYDGDASKILDGVSFRIPPGTRVALVGGSGAGKSTLMSLLLRLYEPQEGSILIDGVNITHYQRESLCREIGIVLQDTVVFGASIEENIAYGKPEATHEEVEEAARQAHAHEFIISLRDGYDTILGERGNTISGGQRQRLCLARAIIKRPSILILDEPTSAVDSISASLICDSLGHIQEGNTLLVIAHQFPTIDQFDQILVLKNGKIIEQGPHDHLLQLKGHYYELFHRQIA